MLAYLVRRTFSLVAVLLVMSFIVFCLQNVIPADPARIIAGPLAPLEVVEAVRERLGLNEPLIVQYVRFLSGLVQGDLGTSVRTRQPVTTDVLRYLPASLELALAALLVGLALAGAVAFLQAASGRSSGARVLLVALGSMPIFLTALLLAYFVWFRLNWLPAGGRLSFRRFSGPTGFNVIDGLMTGRPDISLDALQHLVLPAITLGLPIAVAVGRSLNSALQDVMRQTYIRTSRGVGMSESAVIMRHGLRNAASAPLAMAGIQVAVLLANLLIVERIFAWPGLGLYAVQALATSDLPAVLGVSMVFGTLYILVSIAVEIAQSLADRRITL
jgi:peptide/nickel transport system permease protein/dipeptide transport system permease protein